MARLSAKDLRAALDFVAEVHSFASADAFRHGILPGLQRLVPSDLVGYNEVDPGSEALVLTYPQPVPDPINVELARLAHEHPLISVQMNGDNNTYKISDFLGVRQFRGLELYEVLYSQIGAEDQIAFGLSGPAVIGIAMNRNRRSFSERDREILDLLRPHLAQAHGGILERARRGNLIATLEHGLEQSGAAVVALDRDGGIAAASGAAIELLREYFPGEHGASLPPEIAEWLGGSRPGALALTERDPLVVEAERGRLTVREAPHDAIDAPVLVFEETRPVTPASLQPLGLTHRQAEVLCLLAAEKTTDEIADALFISPWTVRKHFEHIYERLGVHSRAAAISAALETVGREQGAIGRDRR
jgi:DNA-binding CsgD family transcriptional regulator